MSAMTAAAEGRESLEEIEVDVLLEALFRRYGSDFRGYDRNHLRGRLRAAVEAEGLTTVSGLQERLLHDPAALGRLVPRLLDTSTAMFRDPGFFRALREVVVPLLEVHPTI